jgi:hypothetical protein
MYLACSSCVMMKIGYSRSTASRCRSVVHLTSNIADAAINKVGYLSTWLVWFDYDVRHNGSAATMR